MKSIAVIATEKEYARHIRRNVEQYLGNYGEFFDYSVREVEEQGEIKEDFILISAFNIFQKVRALVTDHTEIIVISLSLTKTQLEPLNNLDAGTRAYLVNFDERSCLHTMTNLYDAGFRDLELYPYWGKGTPDPTITLAITPNEEELVPPSVRRVMNLGESSVDVRTLYEIADKLGAYDEFSDKEAKAARQEYYYISSGMDRLMGEQDAMHSRMRALIQMMKDGIVVTDNLGKIHLANEKAVKLMSFRTDVLEGFHISEVLPEIDIYPEIQYIINGDRGPIMASFVPIETNLEPSGENVIGRIITLSDFDEREEVQHEVRSRLAGNHHRARYHFPEIIGDSPQMENAIAQAKKMAKSNSSVLVTGESGTGKELFAQSIHNASSRCNRNFVAVNCAAIPENLLESEMFGYEEGSFTGARKGGKAGYFEVAHGGTIFLDEIGEMPLQLQAKLLRVIEERRVTRVGSDKEIDVDVRIISATNQDLFKMVEEGRFREDLYYRLKVLPLELPPLREHPEDIPTLIDHYLDIFHKQFQFNTGAMKRLKCHQWRGNCRELRNVIEYLANQEKAIIREEDLEILNVNRSLNHKQTRSNRPSESDTPQNDWRPGAGNEPDSQHEAPVVPVPPEMANPYYSISKIGKPSEDDPWFGSAKNPQYQRKPQTEFERFLRWEGRDLENYRAILQQLHDCALQGLRPGREILAEELRQRGFDVSTGEVRKYLQTLAKYNFVILGRGRVGSRITPDGENALDHMNLKA